MNFLIYGWKKLYTRFRYNLSRGDKISFVLVILMLCVLIGAAIGVALGERDAERKRRENLSYVKQVESLNNVQQTLNELVDFVDFQRQKLQDAEDLVNRLRAEQEKLKPVVETNRQVIDAILDLQAQKARNDVWKERAVGFGTGVLASFFVALLFRFFDRKSPVIVAEEPTGVLATLKENGKEVDKGEKQ